MNFYRKSSYRLCEKGLWVQCGTISRVGLGVDPADPVLIELNAAADAGGRGETPKLPALPAE